MRIGLISDTHSHWDQRIGPLFRGVQHILHAGDICEYNILVELKRIAPVTAVLGNNDLGLDLRETELVELESKKLLIHHIVNPRAPSEALQMRLSREAPDVVVFGHTHRQFADTIGRTLFINPGYAGRPRLGEPRSVAILEWTDGVFRHEFLAL
jgi:uncharacterized protein